MVGNYPSMKALAPFCKLYERLGQATMPVMYWDVFVKALTLAFVAYWLHLSQNLNDWLGSDGFHLMSPTTAIFPPLPSPWPIFLWWITFGGSLLMFFRKGVATGCLVAGSGFFYVTMCDPASVGALNMHFLFALVVIFWSTSLKTADDLTMMAWPAYLIRLYLVVAYFGSGWRKVMFGDWLSNPNALLHCMTGYYATGLTRWLYHLAPAWGWTLMQYLTIFFELGAPLLLLHLLFRKWGVFLGCLLHLGIAFLMKDLFYFSIQMLTFYIPVLIPTAYLGVASSKRDHQSAM